MKRIALLIAGSALLIGAPLATTGCTGTATATFRSNAWIETTPTLVQITPGVWVVEDYHTPVFYSDGYYWRYNNSGIWYRARTHSTAWVRVQTRVVPTRIRRIDRPRAYVHYRASANAYVRHGPSGKVVRKRNYRADDNRVNRDRRETRRDARDARKERRRDYRADRHDRRHRD